MNNSKPMNRCEVPVEYTWNLQDLCKSDEVFEKQFKTVQELLPEISAFKGRLSEGAEIILSFFKSLKKQSRFLKPFMSMQICTFMKI